MRSFILAVMLLAGCSGEAIIEDGSFAGQGRDRLCIAGERAGVIVYGAGDSNCSASGRLEGLVLVPRGEGECRIGLIEEGGGYGINAVSAGCDYYCGAGSSFKKQRFARSTGPVVDLEGDPLC